MTSQLSGTADTDIDQTLAAFVRLGLRHALCFARSFGADSAAAARWLDAGMPSLREDLPRIRGEARAPWFWHRLLANPLPRATAPIDSASGDEPQLIETLLGQLDETARAAFLLRVWHEFDEQQLAALLDLRPGQVRVGLMRAFGLMRARLIDGIDGDADSGQWLRAFRGRLAALTAALPEDQLQDVERRVAVLTAPPAAEPESDFPSDRVIEEMVAELTADTDDEPDWVVFGDRAMAQELPRATPANPTHGATSGRSRVQWRRYRLLFGLLAVFAGLALVGVFWAMPPSAPASLSRPSPVEQPVASADPPATRIVSRAQRDALLASPDLALLDDLLSPQELAVMDQLRWWAQGADGQRELEGITNLPEVPAYPPVLAEPAPDAFSGLSDSEQTLLAAFSALWPRLATVQRQILRDNAARWQQMSESRRRRAHERAGSLAELAAASRGRARDSHALWTTLPADERSLLRRTYAAFTMLPPDTQRAVAEDFARLPPTEQARWRLSSHGRERLQLAGQVFNFVPQAERSDTLDMLDEMETADREQLQRGSRRLSAWQREQLRQKLLELPAAERSAYLKRRFGN